MSQDMSATRMKGPSSISSVEVGRSNSTKEKLAKPPGSAGNATSSETLQENAKACANSKPSFLSKVGKGLMIGPKSLAVLVGGALYGGTVAANALITTAVWAPLPFLTGGLGAVGGTLGLIVGSPLKGAKAGAKAAMGINQVIAGASLLVRGPIALFSGIGASLLKFGLGEHASMEKLDKGMNASLYDVKIFIDNKKKELLKKRYETTL